MIKKTCIKCGVKKDPTSYSPIKVNKDGLRGVCKTCFNKRKKKYSKQYEKTKKGFLMRAYNNMLSRVRGIQRPGSNHHGLEILPKQEFYKWALENPDFHQLFKEWEESKYDRKLTPSIDRINPEFGYYLLNMQIVTHSENSKRGVIYSHTGRII